jgi:hypothetical protein
MGDVGADNAGCDAGTVAPVCADLLDARPPSSPPPHALNASVAASIRHCTFNRKPGRMIRPYRIKQLWKSVVMAFSFLFEKIAKKGLPHAL